MTNFENRDYVELIFRGEIRQYLGDNGYWYLYDPWTNRRILNFNTSDVHSSTKLEYPEVLEPGSIYRDADGDLFSYDPDSNFPDQPWLSIRFADENDRYYDSEVIRPLVKLFQGASKVSE